MPEINNNVLSYWFWYEHIRGGFALGKRDQICLSDMVFLGVGWVLDAMCGASTRNQLICELLTAGGR